MSNKYKALSAIIDQDQGLASKRKMLIIVSLIILAMQFSGAKVVEANTFILKLSFTHQNGIVVLLFLALCLLMVRYYNYARPYHKELFDMWTSRLLKDNFLYSLDLHEHEEFGIVPSLAVQTLRMDLRQFRYQKDNSISWKYECNGFFSRSIIFSITDEHDSFEQKVGIFKNVKFSEYLLILRKELKYQIKSYLIHREILDIYTPYFLGFVGILSYVFSSSLAILIAELSNLTQ